MTGSKVFPACDEDAMFVGAQFWIADKPLETSTTVTMGGDSISHNAKIPAKSEFERMALNEAMSKRIRELQVSTPAASVASHVATGAQVLCAIKAIGDMWRRNNIPPGKVQLTAHQFRVLASHLGLDLREPFPNTKVLGLDIEVGTFISSAMLDARTIPKPWANVTLGANHIDQRAADPTKQFESKLMSNVINATQTKTIEIKRVVRINGQDADKLSKSQLWALIAEQQDVVKTLEAIEPKPESLKTEIGKRKNGVNDLVNYLDSLEKPENIVTDSGIVD